METSITYQDIVEVLKALPPQQVAEVYDFARFLKAQHGTPDDRAAFLATFGSWQEERSAEEIIAEIYSSRTSGTDERAW